MGNTALKHNVYSLEKEEERVISDTAGGGNNDNADKRMIWKGESCVCACVHRCVC